MGMANPEGRITRRGFLEWGSAALTSVGLIGNAYAAESLLSSESGPDTAKPSSEQLAGKIALEEHFVLAENIETSEFEVLHGPPQRNYNRTHLPRSHRRQNDRCSERHSPTEAKSDELARGGPENAKQRVD